MKPFNFTRCLPAFALTFVFAGGAADAPKPKPTAYQTVGEARAAGADYELQGEYSFEEKIEKGAGRWGIGAQVIALGDDKFRLVVHKGGLPGAGWDKSPKSEVEGKREGDRVKFAPSPNDKNGGYDLHNGVVSEISLTGDPVHMKKVHRTNPTLGLKPPAGATVLFDGSNADAWQNGKMDERKFLRCGTKSKMTHGSGTLHIEFFLPFKPLGRGQDRANSGVYLQDRYEVQVLDSFGLKGENNECGGIYSKHRPLVNMCFPPLTWQTYDIEFEEAAFDAAGTKTRDATLTVKHNGVLIHDKASVNSATTAASLKEGPTPGPIQLQDHGNPVYYRNIWWLPKK